MKTVVLFVHIYSFWSAAIIARLYEKKYEIEESYTEYDEYDNAFICEEADG